MTTQTTLFFVEEVESLKGESKLRSLLDAGFENGNRIIQKDRFSAESKAEFIELTQQQLGRKPDAKDWLRYWPTHQEEFEQLYGRSWKEANAKTQKIVRESDEYWARQRRKEAGL